MRAGDHLYRLERRARRMGGLGGGNTQRDVPGATGRAVSLLERLIDLNEAVDFSLTLHTTKRVLAGLRARAGGDLSRVRPSGLSSGAGYLPRHTPAEMRSALADQLQLPAHKLPAHALILPREGVKQKHLRNWEQWNLPPGRRTPNLDPTDIAMHEHGHAADHLISRYGKAQESAHHRLQEAIRRRNQSAADNLGTKMARTSVRVERRANRNVLSEVAKHGSPEEVQAWKRTANQQMKVGYRAPMYRTMVAATGADRLSEKKAILRRLPFLRRKFTALAAHLATLWPAPTGSVPTGASHRRIEAGSAYNTVNT